MDLGVSLSDVDEVGFTLLACHHCSVTHLDLHLGLISELIRNHI